MKIEEMILKKNSDCCGCEACKNICPQNAISMVRDAEGFAYPKINPELCIKCGKCDATCPSLNFHEKFAEKLPKVLLAINPDEKIRRHSSSGGVFSALGEIILNDGGIVFGAGFDENWHVVHASAENFDEMENLRGSKYVQSQIGETFRRIRNELEKGRKVLFSGTPCQCVGLKSFLGKDFENLLTVDVFCHGVPSPELWEQYIFYRGQGHEISKVDFRNNAVSWGNYRFQITFKDCGNYRNSSGKDMFFQEFSLCTTQRPSCHECKFRFPNSNSDISIGDAWGIKNYSPEMNDGKGTSLAVIHTVKGQSFIDKTKLKTQETEFHIIAAHNPYYLIPSAQDSRRKKFFDDFAKTKNAVITMQKFFLADTTEIKKANSKQNSPKIAAAYRKVLSHSSQRREKNLFVFTQSWTDELKNFINEVVGRSAKSFGVFVANIQSNDKNENFVHCFEPSNPKKIHKIPVEENSLSTFANDFGIKEFFVVAPLNFDMGLIDGWLKSFGMRGYMIKTK